MQKVDLAIIGAGVSGTYLLSALVSQGALGLDKDKISSVVLLDNHAQPGSGITYGSNAGLDTFTITKFSSLFKGAQVNEFLTWWRDQLGRKQSLLRDTFAKDPTLANWYVRHKVEIEKGKLEELYIPRFAVGLYLEALLNRTVNSLSERGISTKIISDAEVSSISISHSGRFLIRTSKGECANAANAVLAIGSPPKNDRWGLSDKHGYIHDPYVPSAEDTKNKLKAVIKSDSSVAVIGSNASALEWVHLIRHEPELLANIKNLVCISPSGALPEPLNDPLQDREPVFLNAKIAAGKLSSVSELVDSAIADVDALLNAGFPINQITKVMSIVVSAVQERSESDKQIFMQTEGRRLLSRTRRGSSDYLAAADKLRQLNILRTVAAEVLSIDADEYGKFLIRHQDLLGTQQEVKCEVVIDCTGSGMIDRRSSKLFGSILNEDSPLIAVNKSGRGFEVNSNFESMTPGLFVFGPLLAGYYDNERMIIHLETTPGIIDLAPIAAQRISQCIIEQKRDPEVARLSRKFIDLSPG